MDTLYCGFSGVLISYGDAERLSQKKIEKNDSYALEKHVSKFALGSHITNRNLRYTCMLHDGTYGISKQMCYFGILALNKWIRHGTIT